MPKQLIEWAFAAAALPGQSESGDLHLVQPFDSGVLLAVLDGLGHGPEAAEASRRGAAVLAAHADDSPIGLVRRCHQSLLRTRGVVMSLASINAVDQTMTWLGVGNVEGSLLRADAEARPRRETVLLRGGTVGYQLPPLRATVLRLTPGDTLVFVSDGIDSRYSEDISVTEAPQEIADRILAQHGKSTDDALVLVARYKGGES